MNSLRNDSWYVCRLPYLIIVLSDGSSNTDNVCFLKGILTNAWCRYLPSKNQKGNTVTHSVGDPSNGIGCPRTTGYNGHTNFPSRLGVAFCFMNTPLLMATKNMADTFKAINSIIEGQDCTTRIAKNSINTKIFQGFQDQLRAGLRSF